MNTSRKYNKTRIGNQPHSAFKVIDCIWSLYTVQYVVCHRNKPETELNVPPQLRKNTTKYNMEGQSEK